MFGVGTPLAIEPLMYFGLGILAATVVAIAIFPFALRRAERLTRRRILSSMPLSMAETSAQRDSTRAMFAIAVRKLETRTEELVRRGADQAAQIGRQKIVNTQLKQALDEKTRLIAALETREGALLSRENALIQELLTLRDENRKSRDSQLPTLAPSAPSPKNRDSLLPLRRPAPSPENRDSRSPKRLPRALSPWK